VTGGQSQVHPLSCGAGRFKGRVRETKANGAADSSSSSEDRRWARQSVVVGGAEYDALRSRHQADLAAMLPQQVERLDWAGERLRRERERRLRALVATAAARSPWHAERLSGVDPMQLEERDLASLPVMTKDDLTEHFDDIVTDRHVTLARAEHHLELLVDGDQYLDRKYHVVSSGGSSGVRGVFVWGWDAWTIGGAARSRFTLRDQMRRGESPEATVVASVAAAAATHMTGAFPQTFPTPGELRLPVSLPLKEIVAGLNRLQPSLLYAYPSALALLTTEASAGRLDIRPGRVLAPAEPLLPEVREAIRDAWGARIATLWGTSEAATTAVGCYEAEGMHVSDDNVILEPVDADGRAVAPGERGAKLYLTNLINPVLPLIRYEISDEVTVLAEPCPCGSSFQRVADIQGRLDDVFRYGDVSIHPHIFRSLLAREPAIVEYQVSQRPNGASIVVRCVASCDLASVRSQTVAALQRAGLATADVEIRAVGEIPRQASGKLKRFVPLPSPT
jgi:phenylacetate-CoA ligase